MEEGGGEGGSQELGLVVQHLERKRGSAAQGKLGKMKKEYLLKVRDMPLLIDRVPAEASANMVVNATGVDREESLCRHLERLGSPLSVVSSGIIRMPQKRRESLSGRRELLGGKTKSANDLNENPPETSPSAPLRTLRTLHQSSPRDC